MIPPRFIIQATLTQMKQFIESSPDQNPFLTTFEQRMAAVPALTERRRSELRAAALKIVTEQVYPSCCLPTSRIFLRGPSVWRC